jgi:hypothetical protein
MGKRDKPIHLGRGFTPLFVTVCLTEKAWKRATKTLLDAPAFPHDLDASCTHFNGENGHSPCSIVTLNERYQSKKKMAVAIGLLCHEMVHAKQFCESKMQTRFDDETEAYYIQHLTNAAWERIEKLI